MALTVGIEADVEIYVAPEQARHLSLVPEVVDPPQIIAERQEAIALRLRLMSDRFLKLDTRDTSY